MLNNLIVMRLEVSDTGDDFKGNNRVSEDFEKEFESFLGSSDVLFGREMDYEGWGNSGYRVYIYDYGMAGFALFLLFYFFAFRTGRDIRAITTAFVLAMTNFWIRGYPMLFAFVFLLGFGKRCLRLLYVGLGGSQCGFVGHLIDEEEQLAFLHPATLFHFCLLQITLHTGNDADVLRTSYLCGIHHLHLMILGLHGQEIVARLLLLFLILSATCHECHGQGD